MLIIVSLFILVSILEFGLILESISEFDLILILLSDL